MTLTFMVPENSGKSTNPTRNITQPTPFDQIWWNTHNFATPLVFFLLFIVCVLVTQLYRPLFQSADPSNQSIDSTTELVDTFQINNNEFFFVAKPNGLDTTDIYSQSLINTTVPLNLTNSRDYSEFYPVFLESSKNLAFIAVSSNGDRSLRILKKGSPPQDITANNGNTALGKECQISFSQIPQWSPDGNWIAFLADCQKKTRTTELLVAPIDGSGVRQVSNGNSTIQSFEWFDNNTIIFTELNDTEEAIFFQADLNGSILKLTPPSLP